MKPLVSIVIPTLNRAHVIDRALKSCQQQTFQDFEVIIVDDHRSKDDIAQATAFFDQSRLRLMLGFEGSAAAARNAGARAGQGEFISFLDSDDEFLPNKLERCIDALRKGDADVVYSQTYVDRGVNRLWIKPRDGIESSSDIFEYFFVNEGWVHPSTVVLKAKCYEKCAFDEKLGFGDDEQFAIDLARNGFKIQMIKEPLAIYSDPCDAQQLSKTPIFEPSNSKSNQSFQEWSENLKHLMSERTRAGFMARRTARFVARQSPLKALSYVWQAYKAGAVSSRRLLSLSALIFVPRTYHALSNVVANYGGIEVPDVVRKMRSPQVS
ncbi:MAG: glycosyltransferase family 2 protein [Hyphomicrobiales bacterium]|nr:glycosyltransferase family 2 protein [Hyphomicrobiales bacterium]